MRGTPAPKPLFSSGPYRKTGDHSGKNRMATKSERYGKMTLRWQPAKDGGFEGAVIVGRERGRSPQRRN
jgi:hypothetical protein